MECIALSMESLLKTHESALRHLESCNVSMPTLVHLICARRQMGFSLEYLWNSLKLPAVKLENYQPFIEELDVLIDEMDTRLFPQRVCMFKRFEGMTAMFFITERDDSHATVSV